MILVWLIVLLLIGGAAAGLLGRESPRAARWVSLITITLGLLLTTRLWSWAPPGTGLSGSSTWVTEVRWDWIPHFGISFHLGADGLSILMLLLTFSLGLMSVACSWTEITERVGFFHFNLLWVLAGIVGVFLALDLFLFYFFWELMLVPMYLLIGIWGHENRIYAAIKFFIFTQAGGLLMLLAILGLYFINLQATGVASFDYEVLLDAPVGGAAATWLMLGFFVAFVIKVPAVPVHTWLPDAHTEAPTAGSVILAGLLLKTGAYGLLRFVLPLFPEASHTLAPVAMTLGVVGVLYGAVLAFAQTDLKRMVAYTSVSHLGFVLLGVYAWNQLALQGAVMQMITHGLSTGALFIVAGALYERAHTRDLSKMGGLWAAAPRMGAVTMFFAMASLGLPGLGNFVAEFLVLLGAFQAQATLSILATIGLVIATAYSLRLVQRTFHGGVKEIRTLRDLSTREMLVLGSMAIALVWLGLYPQPVLDTAEPFLRALQDLAPGAFWVVVR